MPIIHCNLLLNLSKLNLIEIFQLLESGVKNLLLGTSLYLPFLIPSGSLVLLITLITYSLFFSTPSGFKVVLGEILELFKLVSKLFTILGKYLSNICI